MRITRAYAVLFLLLTTIITSAHASAPAAGRETGQQPYEPDARKPQEIGVSGAAQTPADPRTTSAHTLFIPLVTRTHYAHPHCSPDSPFSLQIAALHQVEPEQGVSQHARSLAEAEWLARYDEAFPTLVEAMADSGACWARVRINWSWIQPDPPPAGYVWGPYHDEKLGLVAESGVNLIAHVDEVPAWAGDSAFGPIDPEYLDEFAGFLFDLVSRYKDPPYDIHHWELFNEPDRTVPYGGQSGWGNHGDLYAQMLTAAYHAIKTADPGATVLMGGVAYDWFTEYGGPFYRYFPDDVMANQGAQHLDVVNFHYFPDYRLEWERWVPGGNPPTCGEVEDGVGTPYEAWGIDLIAKANHLRNRLRTCFDVDKPIWVTELGEHGRAGDPASLAQQARYVIQGYTRGLAAGVENITWFALVSPPYDPFNQGLLYAEDWSPKPAYYAYQTLSSELASYTYAYTLDAPDMEAYLFRDRFGHEKMVAWWAAEWPSSGSFTFGSTSVLRVVDRAGEVAIVKDGELGDMDGVQNGAVELRMTVDPVFISE